tara:strand:- start:259 stop:1305 length:1047 start_codon:yes stop_codon:yes gene_type:complete
MQTEKNIKKLIINRKELRLDKFIYQCLYDVNGYYSNSKPIGKRNDFVTAPEISQMFGEIICLYIIHMWKENINSKFNFIELGPGNGTLLKDIVNTALKINKRFFDNSIISLIETNKSLIKVQQKVAKELKLKRVSWSSNLNVKSRLPLIIYSNEFFDCFPIRHFIYKDFWYEKFISYNELNRSLYFKEKKVHDKNLLKILKKYEKQKIYEISIDRNKYFEKICKIIKRNKGIFLSIDYGYSNKIENFTLQALKNHKYSNIFENIGNQDISSYVNFKEFIDIAKRHKLKIEEYCTQRDFLIKYGILERQKILSEFKNLQTRKVIQNELERLVGKNQMGDLFKFLIVSKL